MDGDGDPDLVVSGNSLQGTIVNVYLNDGSGSFEKAQNKGIVPVYLSEIEIRDMDNDGRAEIIITGLDSSYKRRTRIYKSGN